MKYLFIIFLTGCAEHHWESTQKNPDQQKFALAHSDCSTKAAVAVGPKRGSGDWFYPSRVNHFMEECMLGQGYEIK